QAFCENQSCMNGFAEYSEERPKRRISITTNCATTAIWLALRDLAMAGALASFITEAFGFGISRELRAPKETKMPAVSAAHRTPWVIASVTTEWIVPSVTGLMPGGSAGATPPVSPEVSRFPILSFIARGKLVTERSACPTVEI